MGSTSLQRDISGQVIAVTDPLGRVSRAEHDLLGRLTKSISPDADGNGPQQPSETQIQYDLMDNVVAVIDPLSNATSFVLDNLYRTVQIYRA